jgi:hypothetical protein
MQEQEDKKSGPSFMEIWRYLRFLGAIIGAALLFVEYCTG